MLLKPKVKNISANHYKITDNWTGLESITRSLYNIAILQRAIDPEIKDFLTFLVNNLLIEPISEVIFPDQSRDILEKTLGKYQSLNDLGYEKLIVDIENIVTNFCKLTKAKKIDLYFSPVNHTKCPIFHSDFNYLRLVCTYYGEGTLWLTNDNVNFNKIGCGDNNQIVKNIKIVQKMNEFEIGILKGAKFPDNISHPIIHRSPTINETGKIRVLLKLDILE